MNKQEAIKRLKLIYGLSDDTGIEQAIKLAIEALNKPEIIYCHKCIYRSSKCYENIKVFYKGMGFIDIPLTYCSYGKGE